MKNSKKQFFSFKLYLDALKQLRIMGLIMLIFVGFISFASCKLSHDVATVYILSIFSYIFVAPIMTLYLFRFTTSRKASDLFHAIPYTRVCLYLSYVSAIFTWVFAILMTDFMGYLAANRNLKFINSKYILGLIACVLLVVAAINVAQGLTGTLFTNIAVTGVILFIPRLIIYYVVYYIYEICPFLNTKYIVFPFGNNVNLLIKSLVNPDYFYMTASNLSIAYTFALGIIYLVIAAVLFNRRKSETAECAASNRWLQGVIRSFITLMICLFPLSGIIEYYLLDTRYGINIFSIIVIYIIAIFIYFIYELLSTRKVKNLIKAIPGILIVALCNVAVFLCIYGVTKNAVKFRPEADEIEYITISPAFMGENMSLTGGTYVYKLAEDMKIKDEEIINMISKQFNAYMENSANGVKIWYVNFCVDGKVYHRQMRLGELQEDMLLDYFCENDEIINELMEFPDSDELVDIDLIASNNRYSKEDIKSLYESYITELNDKKDDLASIIKEEGNYMEFIGIEYKSSGRNNYLNFKLTPSLPDTFNKYLNMLSKESEKYLSDLNQEIYDMFLCQYEIEFSIRKIENGKIGNRIYFTPEIITDGNYENEYLQNRLLEFLDEASESHREPSVDDTVYFIKIGNKDMVFSANEECREMYEELEELTE